MATGISGEFDDEEEYSVGAGFGGATVLTVVEEVAAGVDAYRAYKALDEFKVEDAARETLDAE